MRKWFVLLIVFAVWGALPAHAQTDLPDFCADLSSPPALPAQPTTAQTLDHSGLQLARTGDFNTATVLFSQALDNDASLFDAYLHRGCAYVAMADTESAYADLQDYIRTSGDTGESASVRAYLVENGVQIERLRCVDGSAYTFQDEARETINSFNEGSADAEAFNERGLANQCVGDTDGALRDFSRALELVKTNAVYYSNRATVYTGLGQYQEALSDLNNSLRLMTVMKSHTTIARWLMPNWVKTIWRWRITTAPLNWTPTTPWRIITAAFCMTRWVKSRTH